MSATSKAIVRRAIKEYRQEIFNEVEKRASLYCEELCEDAIVFRQAALGKHNYTGNLLNSIVVCLYKKKSPVYACYAAERIPKAIDVKMSGPGNYGFTRDYEGVTNSHYNATVPTDKGWGESDARHFFRSYRPEGGKIFTVVVAYPVEYARWVEKARLTTGILNTYSKAAEIGTIYLQLPRK